MTSPTRSLRPSPPRRALHERSDSHVNEVTSPTLRVIGDSDAKIYASTPFPTQASQRLYPDGRKPVEVFEDGVSVSGWDGHIAPSGEAPLPPQITKPSKGQGKGQGKAIANDIHDGFDLELPSSNTKPAPSSPTEKSTKASASVIDARARTKMDQGIDGEGRDSDEIIQLPSVYSSRDGRGDLFASSSYTPERIDHSSSQGMASKSSENSLSSAASTETVVKSNVRGPPPRGFYSYSAFPSSQRPTSSRSTRSFSTPARPVLDTNPSLSPVSSTSPTSSVSPLSPVLSGFPTHEHRVYSAPVLNSSGVAIDNDPSLHYPVIHPPTASGSWAKTSISVPTPAIRMNKSDAPERWSPQLSMVQSEASGGRNSANTSNRGSNMPSKTSSMTINRSSLSSNLPVPPQAAYFRERDASGSTIRVVGEEGDVVRDMPSPAFPHRGSVTLSVLSPGSRRGSEITTGPGSRGSFLRDSIPAWARTYYAHEARNAFLTGPGSTTDLSDNRPQTHESQSNIFRPRTRRRESQRQNRDSMAITPADPINPSESIDDRDVEIRGSQRRTTSQNWSPHLWRDRRSAVKRRTLFKAPSLDEAAEGGVLSPSRRNAQVFLFAAGFLFPLAWIIAAFLPLPPQPVLTPPVTPTTPTVAHDLEKSLGPIDQARYENARWWRNLNRIMSIVGVLVIAAIITLAVVATRIRN